MKGKILGLLAVGLLAGPMTANAFDIRTFSWSIVQTGSESSLVLAPGQQFLVNYSVDLSAIATDSGNPELPPASFIDECVNVVSDVFGFLGSVCIGNPAATTSFYGGFQYSLNVGPYSSPGDYIFSNTATATATDTSTARGSTWNVSVRVPGATVPEPGTLALLGLGLAGLGLSRRRKAN